MRRRHLLALVIFVLAANFLISLTIAFIDGRNQPVDEYAEILRAGTVAFFLGVAVAIFDKWLWRMPIFYGWFLSAPNINGTWDVTGYIYDAKTGGKSKTLTGKMEITQTFFAIQFKIYWENHGQSKSLRHEKLAVAKDGTCAFPTYFQFEALDKQTASTHQAGVYFHSDKRIPNDITLRYSTDRKELGVLSLTNHTSAATWKKFWSR